MKFYLNIAKLNKEKKIDASVKKFDTLKGAIDEFSKHRRLYGDSDKADIFGKPSVCFISTSGENVSYKLEKNLFDKEYISVKFKVPAKLVCGRRYFENEYDLVDKSFDIFYTNYITATRDFEKIMNEFYKNEKRDSCYVTENI